MSQTLYDAVKSGRVKLTDLNEEGKNALRSYMNSSPASAHSQENKQYADLMKSSYQSNPKSFNSNQQENQNHSQWNGIKDNPITNTAIKALDVAGKAYDAVSHLPVINQVTGAMQGAVKPFVPNEETESNQPLWKKYLGNVRDGYNLTKIVRNPAAIAAIAFPKNKSIKDIGNSLLEAPVSAVKGALHPDEARKNLSESLENKSLVTQLAVGSAADPLSYVPIPSIKGVKNATSRLSETLNNLFGKVKPLETETVMQPGPILGLPEPKSTVLAREAQNRSVLPTNETPIYGPGEIYKPEPLGLPEGNYTAPTKLKINNQDQTLDYVLKKIKPQVETKANILHENTAEASAQLDNVNSQVSQLESAYQNEIKSNYEYLKNSMDQRTGVSQGSLIKDAGGEVISRVGRISNNPKWYQDFYRENGRTPTNKDLMELAKKHVEEGHVGDNGLIPSWTKENNYHDTLQSLYQVRDELGKSLNEQLERGVYDIAIQTAKDHGYDLDSLLRNEGGTFGELAARMEKNKAYGVYPESSVNIAKPNFNVQHVSNAAMPESKVKVLQKDPNVSYGPQGMKKDGLTIMEKYFPDGKVDTAILNKLPYEERIQFQKEQTPKNPNIGFDPNSQALENLSATPPSKPDNVNVNNNQAADDVINTAEPRISDKVSGYLEDEIAAANERIKAKRYVSSPDPAAKNADHALIGVTYIEKGTRKLADFTEQMVRQFGEEIRPQVKEIFKQSKQIFNETEDRVQKDLQGLEGIVPAFLKDLSGFRYNSSDIYRNLKDLFKEKFPQIKKAILDPLDVAKLDNVKMQEEWLNKVHENVVENLGIEKGSKLSALTQRYGEKRIDLIQLQKEAPKDWEKVVAADKFFRNAYDTLIDQVNATRKKIYPNNPDKLVPKREDYYRHFQEFSSLTGLKNIFDTPAGIDPHLVGLSEKTLPKSKFAGFMQKRSGEAKFKEDAVGGFLEYLPGASYATHIDPQINVFKNLAKNLASETEKSKNLDNAILFLRQYSQDLAGKTNNFDRIFQENIPGGRKAFKVINWVNGRVKSNTILGNAGSALSQIANVPTGVAFTKEHALKGAGMTLLTALKGNPLHKESQFLKERFFDKKYRKFDTSWLDIKNPLKLKSAAIWALETADRMGTEFIWNSVYEKGLKEGKKNLIKYADDETRRLVAGRGIGEVPLLQKSKVFQTIAPFTLEVANLWKVQKEFIKAKDFGGLALLMLGNYAFNKVSEQVKGSGVTFDPIQAIVEAAAEGLSPVQRAGRIAGEVVSNIPLGGTLASIYPEYGGEVLGADLPTRKELFGDNDPTRFGPGLIAAKGITDPIFKLLPGFGGNQIKKSIDGVKSIIRGGAYKGDKLKAPIEMNPLKAAQSVVFGPNATKEMQTYFKEDGRMLSEKQTQQIDSLSGEDRKKSYDSLMRQRKIESLKAAYKKATENEKLSLSQKQKQVDSLTKKYNELVQAN